MGSSLLTLFLFSLFLLLHPLFSNANLQRTKLFRSSLTSQSTAEETPITTYFQVTKPVLLSKAKPCSSLVLQHDFGYTYGKPPVLAQYKPPSNCPSQDFSQIILEWKASCKGRQYDRIFGVWLGGVELLRSCTAEPRASGITWTVEKDITRYSSLLKTPQTLAVYLGNLVDETYTGVYHVNITFHFYPSEESQNFDKQNLENSASGFDSAADLIIPISRNLPLNEGLWFVVQNSKDFQFKEFVIPRNSYRAVLEVYLSFHENDEFWYGNPPNEYIYANNLTGKAGNGSFREVVVSLDSKVVGFVCPFTVIYTGGVNPLLWRPITGIGSFDLPSYDIEITAFLGEILDGKPHKLGFAVTNAMNVWYIDANLHIWVDRKSQETEGKLVKYESLPLLFSLVSDFKHLNGTFLTSANRSISSVGWVESSQGNITTYSSQQFSFRNSMEMGKNGSLQIVNQSISSNYSIYAMLRSSYMYSIGSYKWFPLYLYTDEVDQGNGRVSVANVSLGFDHDSFLGSKNNGFSVSTLKNLQDGLGNMVVRGHLVTSGLGSMHQVYKYFGSDECYFRNVSSMNYTIIFDGTRNSCTNIPPKTHAFGWKNGGHVPLEDLSRI